MNNDEKHEFYMQYQNALGLKPGDKVKITGKFPDRAAGWRNSWTSSMDEEIGKVRTVDSLAGNKGVRLKECSFAWPAYVLEKIPGNTLAESNEAFRRTVAKLVMVDPVAAKNLLNLPEELLMFQFDDSNYWLPLTGKSASATTQGSTYWVGVLERFREANDDSE